MTLVLRLTQYKSRIKWKGCGKGGGGRNSIPACQNNIRSKFCDKDFSLSRVTYAFTQYSFFSVLFIYGFDRKEICP